MGKTGARFGLAHPKDFIAFLIDNFFAMQAGCRGTVLPLALEKMPLKKFSDKNVRAKFNELFGCCSDVRSGSQALIYKILAIFVSLTPCL